jgi:hypothetical protein
MFNYIILTRWLIFFIVEKLLKWYKYFWKKYKDLVKIIRLIRPINLIMWLENKILTINKKKQNNNDLMQKINAFNIVKIYL